MKSRVHAVRALLVVVTLAAAVANGACGHAPTPVQLDALAQLHAAPAGAYLEGTPTGLGDPVVVNRRDFIYSIAFEPGSQRLAFTHHVSKSMEVTAAMTEPLKPLFQTAVNVNEFDLEDVLWTTVDGKPRVVVPSRQGILRAYDGTTGDLVRELVLGEPLIRVARNASGTLLAVGTSSGRIVLLDASTFDFRGDVHAHDDEVHGLAFTSDHALLSAGFDGKLVVHALTPTDTGTARLATTTLKTGEVVWLSHLDGNRATPTVRDARQPSTLITRAAVQRLHLATLDGVTLPVHRPEGETTAPAVAVGHLRIAGLDVGEVRAAVCDTCVPPGAEIALGMDVLASLDVHEDIATNLLVLAAKPNGSAHAIAGLLALTPVRTIALPGPATDLDTSARGDVLVTFSHARAVRNFDLNQDEHHGKYPPASAQSGAALVDVEHGTLLRQFVSAHEGFTSSGAVSPDGRTVVTGGWDKRAIVFDAATGDVVTERSFAWLVRRVRFAPDGHLLAVAAWTPVNALNEGNSDPALLLYPVLLAAPHLHAP